jgi:hypothetical protein
VKIHVLEDGDDYLDLSKLDDIQLIRIALQSFSISSLVPSNIQAPPSRVEVQFSFFFLFLHSFFEFFPLLQDNSFSI